VERNPVAQKKVKWRDRTEATLRTEPEGPAAASPVRSQTERPPVSVRSEASTATAVLVRSEAEEARSEAERLGAASMERSEAAVMRSEEVNPLAAAAAVGSEKPAGKEACS
jgi:hypothetical protein